MSTPTATDEMVEAGAKARYENGEVLYDANYLMIPWDELSEGERDFDRRGARVVLEAGTAVSAPAVTDEMVEAAKKAYDEADQFKNFPEVVVEMLTAALAAAPSSSLRATVPRPTRCTS